MRPCYTTVHIIWRQLCTVAAGPRSTRAAPPGIGLGATLPGLCSGSSSDKGLWADVLACHYGSGQAVRSSTRGPWGKQLSLPLRLMLSCHLIGALPF